jgi:hypothetical protein
MPTYICHHQGWFFDWSTVVDAPVSLGMNLAQYKQHYRYRYGQDGMEELPDRLKRTLEQGTSFRGGMTIDELIGGHNRAGHDETYLPLDEVIRIYCVEQREPVAGEGIKIEYDDEGNQITET